MKRAAGVAEVGAGSPWLGWSCLLCPELTAVGDVVIYIDQNVASTNAGAGQVYVHRVLCLHRRCVAEVLADAPLEANLAEVASLLGQVAAGRDPVTRRLAEVG